jgi:hypothetical protein
MTLRAALEPPEMAEHYLAPLGILSFSQSPTVYEIGKAFLLSEWTTTLHREVTMQTDLLSPSPFGTRYAAGQ